MIYRGVVQEGKKHGRALGYPTANIELSDELLSGVYVGRVNLEDGPYCAALFADQSRHVLEAHILDFTGNLYGKEIEIEVFEKIRNRIDFDSVSKLKLQILADIEVVKKYFCV